MNISLQLLDAGVYCLTTLGLAILFGSCAGGGGVHSNRASESSEDIANLVQETPNTIVGLWQGTTNVNNCFRAEPGRCGAEQTVSMSIVPNGKTALEGYYKCAYGNQNCLGQNTTGRIVYVGVDRQDVTVRVVLPDTTSCLFMGRMMGTAIKGGYTCYAGGSIREQGAWQARKLY